MATSDFYDSLSGKVQAVTTCQDLADLKTEISNILTANLADIQASIDILAVLITPPTDLGSVIAWITSTIDTYLGPHTKMIALQIETVNAQIALLAELASKKTDLGCS